METFEIVRRYGDRADCDDVVLRETSVSRLVFRCALVNNAKDSSQPVRGELVYQRKLKNGDWEDYNEVKLANLKADEWVKIPLSASETDALVRHVGALYQAHRQSGGLPTGRTRFLRVPSDGEDGTAEEVVGHLLELGERVGVDALAQTVRWFLENREAAAIVDELDRLDVGTLRRLNGLAGLAALKACLEEWEGNEDNRDEAFWQRTLQDHAFVLSQAFSFPFLIIQGKAYVGGTMISGRGGTELDFLGANAVTSNAALVEIKTPATPLLTRDPYRGRENSEVYPPSEELAGAVAQVTHYKYRLGEDFLRLSRGSKNPFEVYAPRCMVIAGHAGRALSSEPRVRSFEAYRFGLRNVTVVTYDELFAKVRMLIEALEGAA